MGNSKQFTGQPVLNQILKFLDKVEISKIARVHGSERYVKKFSTYNHVVVMLFSALEGYHSIREVVLGLFSNTHKLKHVGLNYIVRRSTFPEANERRSSEVFRDIYQDVYRRHRSDLADSRLTSHEL